MVDRFDRPLTGTFDRSTVGYLAASVPTDPPAPGVDPSIGAGAGQEPPAGPTGGRDGRPQLGGVYSIHQPSKSWLITVVSLEPVSPATAARMSASRSQPTELVSP